PLIQAVTLYLPQQGPADHPQFVSQLGVAVQMEVAVVAVLAHLKSDIAQDPYHAKKVVGMFVGEKGVMNLCPVQSHMVELAQDLRSAHSVHQEIILAVIQNEGSIQIFRHNGSSGAQYM